eukprot:1001305-Amorphochlora_amoeboformis.AAC.1
MMWMNHAHWIRYRFGRNIVSVDDVFDGYLGEVRISEQLNFLAVIQVTVRGNGRYTILNHCLVNECQNVAKRCEGAGLRPDSTLSEAYVAAAGSGEVGPRTPSCLPRPRERLEALSAGKTRPAGLERVQMAEGEEVGSWKSQTRHLQCLTWSTLISTFSGDSKAARRARVFDRPSKQRRNQVDINTTYQGYVPPPKGCNTPGSSCATRRLGRAALKSHIPRHHV